MPPAAERDHLKPLQDGMEERNANARMEASIRIALNNAGRSSPAFATAAVKWAQDVANKPAGNETQQWMREEAIVTAALIGVRDGGADLIVTHADWIRETLLEAVGWIAAHRFLFRELRAHLLGWPRSLAPDGRSRTLVSACGSSGGETHTICMEPEVPSS